MPVVKGPLVDDAKLASVVGFAHNLSVLTVADQNVVRLTDTWTTSPMLASPGMLAFQANGTYVRNLSSGATSRLSSTHTLVAAGAGRVVVADSGNTGGQLLYGLEVITLEGTRTRIEPPRPDCGVGSAAISPDGTMLVLATTCGHVSPNPCCEIFSINLATNESRSHGSGGGGPSFLDENSVLLSSQGWGQPITILDLKTDRQTPMFPAHPNLLFHFPQSAPGGYRFYLQYWCPRVSPGNPMHGTTCDAPEDGNVSLVERAPDGSLTALVTSKRFGLAEFQVLEGRSKVILSARSDANEYGS